MAVHHGSENRPPITGHQGRVKRVRTLLFGHAEVSPGSLHRYGVPQTERSVQYPGPLPTVDRMVGFDMPSGSKSREDVVQILVETFRREGVDAATLTVLSEATGLGRSSLYHHFPGGKADMEEQVLKRVDAMLRELVIGPLRDPRMSPGERIECMVAVLDDLYAGGTKRCIVERLCASSQRRGDQRLSNLVVDWIAALGDVLDDAGASEPAALAEDAVACLQGALILCDATRSPDPFRRVSSRVRERLLATISAPAR